MRTSIPTLVAAILLLSLLSPRAQESPASTAPLADPKGASFTFSGQFPPTPPSEEEEPLIFSTHSVVEAKLDEKSAGQRHLLSVRVLQGKLKELTLRMTGDGDTLALWGDGVLDWGVRRDTNDQRFLVIRIQQNFQQQTNYSFTVATESTYTNTPYKVSLIAFSPEKPAFSDGFLKVDAFPAVELDVENLDGLTPIERRFYPGDANVSDEENKWLTFRFSGAPYQITLNAKEADPDRRKIRFNNFNLAGTIENQTASFILTGVARVNHPDGGELQVLGGPVALTDFTADSGASIVLQQDRYLLRFQGAGTFQVKLLFDAQITEGNGWKRLAFTPPPSALRPVTLSGLTADTQARFVGAADAKRAQEAFQSYLPAAGPLDFRWQEARPDVEGKLFFAVTGNSEIVISPGLIRQTSLLDYKVMQGELQELVLALDGPGQITGVIGNGILNWTNQLDGDSRRLIVQLNQAQKNAYSIAIQIESPLGAFPLAVKPLHITPVGAIRFGGHVRVVNNGAVRLEILNAPGLAQISPQLFPKTALGELKPQQQSQAFAFRFSGPEFDLEIQADDIVPELSLSQVLVYHLGETEAAIDAELELDIREAPLRELDLVVPGGYVLAYQNLELGDHILGEAGPDGTAPLKIQFTAPLIGRQVIQLRLSQSHTTPPATWPLVPIQVLKAKSVRGFIGASADAGLRLSASQTDGLTEIATAFFPKRLAELQLAYRLRNPSWSASLASERLALSIQVDSLQLFSIGEGLAYGSTVLNYLIAGAPVSAFKLQVPSNYANVEFVGKDIRDRRQVDGGYEVYLHTAVSGTYSLLATYDVQFNPRGEELPFNGIQPLEIQSEQGHIIVVSTYQFETEPTVVSPGLIPVEPGEIPTEYRLLFDAPILAAYQFTTRPYDLQLRLALLNQGETVNQVVDRATFHTRVSGEGQALTDITYLIKTKGHSHLRITVPPSSTLWEAQVNGTKVVPVTDQQATLIPLPQNIAPNIIIPVHLKVAAKSDQPSQVRIALPIVNSPILLADWKVEPDPAYRLDFRSGNISPNQSPGDVSGFAWIARLFYGQLGSHPRLMLLTLLASLILGVAFCRWGTRAERRRFDVRNILGIGLGAAGLLIAAGALLNLMAFATGHPLSPSPMLAFVVPIQAPGSTLEIVLRNRELDQIGRAWLAGWPAYFALIAWGYALLAQSGRPRQLTLLLGWILLFWSALRLPNGAAIFLAFLGVFGLIHLLVPLWLRQNRLPKRPRRKPAPETPPPSPPSEPSNQPPSPDAGGGATGATTALLAAALIVFGPTTRAATPQKPVIAQSVTQSARVIENHVFVQATLTWNAKEGTSLDFLHTPAVLTRVSYPQPALTLVQDRTGNAVVYRLTAREPGVHRVEFEYEVELEQQSGAQGFHLHTQYGLINRLTLELDQVDVEMASPNAISAKRLATTQDQTTRFDLALAPVPNAWIAWKPRSRDVTTESTVFYAKLYQLFIPTAGVIEGSHVAQIQTAQGQVKELNFQTPDNLTITDVQAQNLSNWRFDPDTRQLRVQFDPAPTGQFVVRLESQVTTSPLPFEKQVGLLSVDAAAGDVSTWVGIATGSEVQLAEDVSPLNLIPDSVDGFPESIVALRGDQVPGLRVRKAFRTSDPAAQLTLRAAAVQPDIRVTSQQTLSLGEDRTVLAVRLGVSISKAGVFKLSFPLPPGMDVESLTGPALSHWTELNQNDERIVTLHLKEKTEGDQNFTINLTGPGAPAGTGWVAPRLTLREASKQTGQIVVAPEQGMRLSTAARTGVSQLDPKDAGIRQKGVLAFRLLRSDWELTFDIEKVDAWIQAVTLQDATVREGQIKVSVNLDYTIENAGVKSFLVQMPANAEAVVFTGEQVADSVRSEDPAGDTVQWEIKLDRRVIGSFKLQVTYQVPSSDTEQENIVGVHCQEINQQRNYITLRTSGRLQLSLPSIPPSLQPAEWRSIPVTVRGSKTATEGNYTFRALDPDYRLIVGVVRHSAVKLLPARVLQTELNSALSDSGEMLTTVQLQLQPGDTRLLELKLPAGARFWFAFVNNSSSWPWQKDDKILIPLESNSDPNQAVTVEFLYSLHTNSKPGRVFDFGLLGPEFNLPLEKISWHVFLPYNRELDDWESGLQLTEEAAESARVELDLQSYIQRENTQQQQQTQEAENLLQLGNEYLNRGQQREARQAFSSAWSLSQHDDAFNEDARVQLQNLKMQQALVGLNYRRNSLALDQNQTGARATNAALNILAAGQQAQYTQQQVKQALDQNSPEDNGALIRLAEHLVEQQDAAQAAPEAIRATLPTQGKRLTFTRSLQVDPFSELKIDLETKPTSPATPTSRFGLLLALFLGLLILTSVTRPRSETEA